MGEVASAAENAICVRNTSVTGDDNRPTRIYGDLPDENVAGKGGMGWRESVLDDK